MSLVFTNDSCIGCNKCIRVCPCLGACVAVTEEDGTERIQVDPAKCIGCGVCTTKCEFDAIRLHRELPECSTMRTSEEKLKYVLSYGAKQAIKIKFSKKDK